MTLLLNYRFTPNPYPIQCSEEHGIDSVVDLGVTVAPANGAVDLREVQIVIPTGSAAGLTVAPALPQPQPDPSTTGWKIDTNGGDTVQITPASGVDRKLDSQVAFTIPGIVVSPDVGEVDLAISETYADGSVETDETTYKLSKQAFAFAVDYFKACPSDLTSLYKSVKLFWHVITDGSVGYRLSSPGWKPPKPSYDDDDGTNGVETHELTDTTQFTLEVVSAESGVLGSATCWVTSRLAQVLPGAKLGPSLGATGCVLAGQWKAKNANRVSIEVDNQTVDGNAPSDAWREPYPVVVPGAGPHDVAITAHGPKGSTPDAYHLGSITVKARTTVQAKDAVDLVLTRDGRFALVVGTQTTTIVDLASGDVEDVDMSHALHAGAHAVAVTTASGFPPGYGGSGGAVLVGTSDGSIFYLNQGDWTLQETFDNRSAGGPSAMACTRNTGVFVLLYEDDATVFSLATGGLQDHFVRDPVACAVAPDDTLALVSTTSGEVAVVNLTDGKLESTTITAGTSGGPIAVSADGPIAKSTGGAFAVVAEPAAAALAVLDIASRKRMGKSISLPDEPGRVAISPDGTLAVVALPGKGAICVVDLLRRRASPTLIPVGGPPSGVAVAHEGAVAVLVDEALLTL